MVGTRHWPTDKVVWILSRFGQGLSQQDTLTRFNERFPDFRLMTGHVTDQGMRYVRNTFRHHPDFNQVFSQEERDFILGLQRADMNAIEVLVEFEKEYPHHQWPTHKQFKKVQGIEFVWAKYGDPENANGYPIIPPVHGTSAMDQYQQSEHFPILPPFAGNKRSRDADEDAEESSPPLQRKRRRGSWSHSSHTRPQLTRQRSSTQTRSRQTPYNQPFSEHGTLDRSAFPSRQMNPLPTLQEELGGKQSMRPWGSQFHEQRQQSFRYESPDSAQHRLPYPGQPGFIPWEGPSGIGASSLGANADPLEDTVDDPDDFINNYYDSGGMHGPAARGDEFSIAGFGDGNFPGFDSDAGHQPFCQCQACQSHLSFLGPDLAFELADPTSAPLDETLIDPELKALDENYFEWLADEGIFRPVENVEDVEEVGGARIAENARHGKNVKDAEEAAKAEDTENTAEDSPHPKTF